MLVIVGVIVGRVVPVPVTGAACHDCLRSVVWVDYYSVNHLLDAHIGHVDRRIAELVQLKAQLVELRQCCKHEQALGACGILQGLAAMTPGTGPQKRTHLG